MTRAILLLPLVSFVLSWTTTLIVRQIAPKLGFVDRPGGRKIHANPKPLGGGIAIFAGVALPLLGILILLHTPLFNEQSNRFNPALVRGAIDKFPLALGLIGAMLAIHLLGLFDDRKAMGPYLKLFIQLAVISAFVILCKVRVLTVLDHYGLGRGPSWLITILWIGAITNAFNFLDNMIAALSIQQWFVAATLAILLGAVLGFLCFNFSPATIFMGDSGSLLIGLLLGILTTMTTYIPKNQPWSEGWYAVFAPVIVLALPLYDLIVVSTLRLIRGKSPFVGDTNHFSHRLVARGMSRRTAVLCLYLITASTSVAAILLPHVSAAYAPLIFAQTILILGVVGLLEQHPLPMTTATEQISPSAVNESPADESSPKPVHSA